MYDTVIDYIFVTSVFMNAFLLACWLFQRSQAHL